MPKAEHLDNDLEENSMHEQQFPSTRKAIHQANANKQPPQSILMNNPGGN